MAREAEQVPAVVHPLVHGVASEQRRGALLGGDEVQPDQQQQPGEDQPGQHLPDGEGLLRFRCPDEAVEALAKVEADYQRHCRAARELAETCFDGRAILTSLLDTALSSPAREATA